MTFRGVCIGGPLAGQFREVDGMTLVYQPPWPFRSPLPPLQIYRGVTVKMSGTESETTFWVHEDFDDDPDSILNQLIRGYRATFGNK